MGLWSVLDSQILKQSTTDKNTNSNFDTSVIYKSFTFTLLLWEKILGKLPTNEYVTLEWVPLEQQQQKLGPTKNWDVPHPEWLRAIYFQRNKHHFSFCRGRLLLNVCGKRMRSQMLPACEVQWRPPLCSIVSKHLAPCASLIITISSRWYRKACLVHFSTLWNRNCGILDSKQAFIYSCNEWQTLTWNVLQPNKSKPQTTGRWVDT